MPLCIDLFCGLGGWAEGFLAEGYEVIDFDIERHRYPALIGNDGAVKRPGMNWSGSDKPGYKAEAFNTKPIPLDPDGGWMEYPGQLVLQDVVTLHGSQFRHADCIVASPPCTEYSYMAMPWTRAKQIAAALRGHGDFPRGYTGSRTIAELNALFDACFRIQREACEAAGRYIPLVVENVKGAQPWVGRAKWHYGSYYLWGDVPALMPTTAEIKGRGQSWFGEAHGKTFPKNGNNPARGNNEFATAAGIKQNGSSPIWFDTGIATHSSKSLARKAASAMIAKIPFPLAHHIAKCYLPMEQPA